MQAILDESLALVRTQQPRRSFLDLPGEIRNIIYDILARSDCLEVFDTYRQIPLEAAAASADWITFRALVNYWLLGAHQMRAIPVPGTATELIQDICIRINMSSGRAYRGQKVLYCPRVIEYFGGSEIARNQFSVVLGFLDLLINRHPIGMTLGEQDVLKSIRTLTGFESLMIRIDSYPTWSSRLKEWRQRRDILFEEMQEFLEPALGPGRLLMPYHLYESYSGLCFAPLSFVRGE